MEDSDLEGTNGGKILMKRMRKVEGRTWMKMKDEVDRGVGDFEGSEDEDDVEGREKAVCGFGGFEFCVLVGFRLLSSLAQCTSRPSFVLLPCSRHAHFKFIFDI